VKALTLTGESSMTGHNRFPFKYKPDINTVDLFIFYIDGYVIYV